MSGILHPLFGRVIGAVAVRLVDRGAEASFGLDDEAGIETCFAIVETPRLSTCRGAASTVYRHRMLMTHAWDGELGRYFLAVQAGEPWASLR